MDTGVTSNSATPLQRQEQGELEAKLLVLPLLPSSSRRRIPTPLRRGFANIQFSLQPFIMFHSSPGPKCFPSKGLIQEIKSRGTEDGPEPPKAQ